MSLELEVKNGIEIKSYKNFVSDVRLKSTNNLKGSVSNIYISKVFYIALAYTKLNDPFPKSRHQYIY